MSSAPTGLEQVHPSSPRSHIRQAFDRLIDGQVGVCSRAMYISYVATHSTNPSPVSHPPSRKRCARDVGGSAPQRGRLHLRTLSWWSWCRLRCICTPTSIDSSPRLLLVVASLYSSILKPSTPLHAVCVLTCLHTNIAEFLASRHQ